MSQDQDPSNDSSNSSVTFFRWTIPNFQKQFEACRKKEEDMLSPTFSLITRPWIKFALRYDIDNEEWSQNWYGLILMDFTCNQPVEVGYKFWLENEAEEKMCEWKVYKHSFGTVGLGAGLKQILQKDMIQMQRLYHTHQTLFFCCEIVDLSNCVDCTLDRKFQANQLAMYEEELFLDGSFLVGEEKKEFKISRIMFSAQSPVFKRMFLQTNFIEAQRSQIEIKDISEETMKALAKWMYSKQLDNGKKFSLEDLFVVADKYDIELLKYDCTKKMITTLRLSNVLSRFALSAFYEEKELMEETFKYIKECSLVQMAKVLNSPLWDQVKKVNPTIAEKVVEFIENKKNISELKNVNIIEIDFE